MKVIFTRIDTSSPLLKIEVDLDVLPRHNEEVVLFSPEDSDSSSQLYVRHLVHYPLGGKLHSSPYVYVALGAFQR